MTSHHASHRRTATHFESLEQRRLLSAGYTVTDLSRIIPDASRRSIAAVAISNGGLIAINARSRHETSSSQIGYIYSMRSDFLYDAPLGDTVDAISNRGGAVFSNATGNEIVYDGLQAAIQLTVPTGGAASFTPTSINDDGVVAGAVETFYPGDPLGSITDYQSEVFASDGSSFVTLPTANPFYNPGMSPKINDAGELTTFADNSDYQDHAVVYNITTQSRTDIGAMFGPGTAVTATDINQNGVVVGNYQRGRSVGGIFEFDTSNNALTLIPNAAGEVFTANAISDNGTIVGQVQSAVRVRNHVRTALHAASFTSTGTVTDLDAQSAPPTGVTLTEATGVNTSGDILAKGTDASGVQHVYLLEPNS